jgi:undecaprenyl-diphosphatase
VTEFLPVSSTAHLVLFPWLLGWPDPGQTFDVALHAGTLVAVIVYFWSDWVAMVTRRYDLLGMVVVGSIPGALAGKFLEDKLAYMALPHQFKLAPLIIAFFLAFVGLLLYWADQRGKKRRELEKLDFQDALLIGIAQMFALLPGVSRSGSTIGAGLLLGLTREAAARFSFYLSGMIIAGAVALKGFHLMKEGIPPGQASPMALGILASALSGYFAIHFLMRWVRTKPYTGFVVYRVLLAVVIAALWFIRK